MENPNISLKLRLFLVFLRFKNEAQNKYSFLIFEFLSDCFRIIK